MAKKQIRDAYYTKWDEDEHLTAFGKHLEDDQNWQVQSDIVIPDKYKFQFYLKQMYASRRFDKQEMLEWEKQPQNTKQDYVLAQKYFETIVKATDTYRQNAGSTQTKWPTWVMKSGDTSNKLLAAITRKARQRCKQKRI